MKYREDKKVNLLFFSSLAMGLSFGVKSTGVIGSIPLIIWYIAILRKDFIKYFLFLTGNFLIFSSYNYVLNFINYGNFLGSYSAITGHGFWGGYKGLTGNFIRYLFQFVDFSGFTIGFYLNEHLLNMQDFVLGLFNIPKGYGANVGLNFTNISMSEQVIGFGILGFTVFIPCVFAGLFNKKLRCFSILFFSQIFVLSFSICYMIYSVRFIVTFVSLSLPLLTISYFKKMNPYKFLIIPFAIFYMAYSSLFLSQRPLFHLKREFEKTPDIKLIQDKMRDLNYKFYSSFNEAYTLKSGVEPYCADKNNIGIFVSNGYMLYSAKYLELSRNCKINALSALHINNYNLNDYDIIITQKTSPQKTEAINKSDILNPMAPNYKAICYFEGPDKTRRARLYGLGEIKKATAALCKVNEEFIKESGFKRAGEIEAQIPKYLQKRENETVKDFIIWEKTK